MASKFLCFVLPGSILTAGLLAACYTGPVLGDPYAGLTPTQTIAPDAVKGSFDCKSGVTDVLSACSTCHGIEPVGNDLVLVTRSQLLARSASSPTKTVAQVSLERMQDVVSPMPPTGVAAKADVDKLAAWLNAGMPEGACAVQQQTAQPGQPGQGNQPGQPSQAAVDGGTDSAAAKPPNLFGGPSTCTSGEKYQGKSGFDMRPGEACNACHTSLNVRTFTIAGTVYPTGHEPNDCVGTKDGSVRIVLTDSAGKETFVPVPANQRGNFALDKGTLTGAYAVRVETTDGAKVRKMGGKVKLPGDGDCNRCHSDAGSEKAPGRVVIPQ
jgi:cytochrome c553